MFPPVLELFKFVRPFREQLIGLFFWQFCLCLFLAVHLKISLTLDSKWIEIFRKIETVLVGLVIFWAVFLLYAQYAALIGWVNKGKYAFWDLLAGQFLQRRLYIPNPPYTHDLTLYKGNWYVPMPPLPAIMMVPLALLIGADEINASYFSIFFSALNGVILYFILLEMRKRAWIQTSISNIFILVILFLFGTPHFWVGISGRGWYVSQILTVFFLGFAALAALRSLPAWWIGVFIGLAVTARPNSLMSWPFMFAIAMQVLYESGGTIDWKKAFWWSVKTAVPIGAAVAALLFYNYLRFEDWMDFGYKTVNAGADIVASVQAWGIFHPHFIPRNLEVMFFYLPWWNPASRWPIEPSAAGMSVFLTTPALIYLFHRYPKSWWVAGAWTAVAFNVFLLSMYHNTGAHQFGYRYILDFQVPLFVLMAVGFNKKVPWHFLLMVLLSIAVNLYGADWFMNG